MPNEMHYKHHILLYVRITLNTLEGNVYFKLIN